jgi:glutamate 5-kinase
MENSQRVIVKVGTSTLTGGSKKLFAPQMVELVRQLAVLRERKHQVVLVSSGAIAAGRETLGYPTLPKHLPAKQMLAAVGQPHLMTRYEQYFEIYKLHTAQVLLTRGDFSDRVRFLNAKATLGALLDQGIIPIINENDTVATEEIRFGDNDNLSAQIANLLEADVLILLTDQDGLYTSDPRTNSNANLIALVGPEPFSDSLWQAAGGSQGGLGTGGMTTKLQAAELARHGGTEVIIARGDAENVLPRLLEGESLGTRFLAVVNKLEGRKRRILTGSQTRFEVTIDEGAVQALLNGGSLLPAGMTHTSGTFERGDAVKVVSKDKKVVAIGLTNYSAPDLNLLIGRQTSEIETVLGFTSGDEVIHRDHLVLL